ncbi:hypothetical protein L596_001071 [Steinernema carpocapsae]|uniref:Uncharacterized protein n=1 Tax=Steinernema carpocapsae TaxID=34508 RepID=A0A4U8UKD8_STECR|nr:hypothetical protein L596_001071 [Steinernema carpocapsae]
MCLALPSFYHLDFFAPQAVDSNGHDNDRQNQSGIVIDQVNQTCKLTLRLQTRSAWSLGRILQIQGIHGVRSYSQCTPTFPSKSEWRLRSETKEDEVRTSQDKSQTAKMNG